MTGPDTQFPYGGPMHRVNRASLLAHAAWPFEQGDAT